MENPRISLAYPRLFHAVCSPYMEEVIGAARECFGRPVLFVDEYFHLVSMSPERPIGNALWDAVYQNKSLQAYQEMLMPKLEQAEGSSPFRFFPEGECAFCGFLAPVLLERRPRGYVLIFWSGKPPQAEDWALCELVLGAIQARASTRTKTIGSWSISLSEKMTELLDPDTGEQVRLLAASAISASLEGQYAVCAAPYGDLPKQKEFAEYAVQELQQFYHQVICVIYGQAVVLLCGGLPSAAEEQDVKRTYLIGRLQEFFLTKDMLFGISDRFSNPADLGMHYRQALLSARLAEQQGFNGAVSFTQLMPLPIFMPLVEQGDAEAFIPPELLAIRAYDETHSTTYMETLRAYSLGLFKKKEVAQKLHIHVNTLSYRLGQIEQLFGIGSETQKDQIRLACSFLILELENRTRKRPRQGS